ncbi:DUF6461 domain-containing protein [Planomonospora corallina]|uniref:DUF6461 domain-containing protein n=1 Tax=Planomonospora corallina TaxID=1806052 RepID=A0ABV8IC48_9ACTN
MIASPDDYAWLAEAADGSYFTYVRGLTPEQVMIRLGGRPEEFTPMTFDELGDAAYSRYGSREPGAFLGLTAINDWTLIVESWGLPITEKIIMPLSAGTRLVTHYLLDIERLDDFYWFEDGKLRFYYITQEGYTPEVPDELTETMNRINSDYPHAYPYEGPMFLLAERLTGITLTPQLLEESTYLCGVVPEPLSTDVSSAW